MTSALAVLAKIKIPAEAVVPLVLATVTLLVLLFAGAALQSWKQRNPKGATMFGMIIATVLSGAALYMLIKLVPQQYENDRVHLGVRLVSSFDAPIAGFLVAIATVMWRYGNQKWIGAGIGFACAAALLAKPLAFPLIHIWDDGERQWGIMDLEHLAFFGPGIVVAVVSLIVALSLPPQHAAANAR